MLLLRIVVIRLVVASTEVFVALSVCGLCRLVTASAETFVARYVLAVSVAW